MSAVSWEDVIYQYDGSFDGFLCCVHDSYIYKEFPIAFEGDEESCVLLALFRSDGAHADGARAGASTAAS